MKSLKDVKTVAFVSLGCPKNLVDSERMLGLLAADGLAVTGDTHAADAIVINTCGFLEASKTESMKEIHEAIRLKEEGSCRRVIVAGCRRLPRPAPQDQTPRRCTRHR
jgi:ribosomal protein S12 methylthiotransferase